MSQLKTTLDLFQSLERFTKQTHLIPARPFNPPQTSIYITFVLFTQLYHDQLWSTILIRSLWFSSALAEKSAAQKHQHWSLTVPSPSTQVKVNIVITITICIMVYYCHHTLFSPSAYEKSIKSIWCQFWIIAEILPWTSRAAQLKQLRNGNGGCFAQGGITQMGNH